MPHDAARRAEDPRRRGSGEDERGEDGKEKRTNHGGS
jgi:hypothetical protein